MVDRLLPQRYGWSRSEPAGQTLAVHVAGTTVFNVYIQPKTDNSRQLQELSDAIYQL